MKCIQILIDEIEQKTRKNQTELEGSKTDLGRMFGRYHLNYLWSVLALQIDYQ
jgi:hypothetical protein